MKVIWILILVLMEASLTAQLPNTNIYLFELDKKNPSVIKKVKKINQESGYNNQPSFSLNEKIIYFSSDKNKGQTDIFSYQISSSKTKPLGNTPESEYSPVEFVKEKISTVTVLNDSSQIIQIYQSKTFSVITGPLQKTDSVGYYAFLNNDTVIYFKLTQPHSLRFVSQSTGLEGIIAESPTRTFKAISRNKLLYGIKTENKTRYFIYDFVLHKANLFAEKEGVYEDAFWQEDDTLWISENDVLLRYKPAENFWEPLYSLSKYGINKISRFAFSKNGKYLVVVNNH